MSAISGIAIAYNDSVIPKTSSASAVKWDKLNLINVVSESANLPGSVIHQLFLRDTRLSCEVETQAGSWKIRQTFIERVVGKVVTDYPKTESLFLISLGSDYLLPEYIIGSALIEAGFDQINFFLVDPDYAFGKEKNWNLVFKDFRDQIQLIYQRTHSKPFPYEKIHFFSRSQKAAAQIPNGAHVVMIESLPPYAETTHDIQRYHVKPKKPEEFFLGSYLVPPEHANAISFIPNNMIPENITITDCLPLIIEKSTLEEIFYVDWGCKIGKDGSYVLNFEGGETYIPPNLRDNDIKFELGVIIKMKDLLPHCKRIVEEHLAAKINLIKAGDSEKKLTQDDVTGLLNSVNDLFCSLMPGVKSFFSADYSIDRNEAWKEIELKASCTRRPQSFILRYDDNNEPAIYT